MQLCESNEINADLKERVLKILNCCENLWEHVDEINQNHFGQFLDEPWMEQFLSTCLKSNREAIYSSIYQFKDHPTVIKLIKAEVTQGSFGGIRALLHLSRKSDNCAWAKGYLLEKLQENKNEGLFARFSFELSAHYQDYSDFLGTWHQWLDEGKPEGVNLLLRVFSVSKASEATREISNYLLEKACDGDAKFQTYTIVLMGMYPDNILNELFEKFTSELPIGKLEERSQIWLTNGMRWGHLIERKMGLIEEKLGDKYRIFTILRKEIDSYFSMHLFFLDPTSISQSNIPENRPEFFPKVDGILMGSESVQIYGLECGNRNLKFVEKVARELSEEGVTVYQCSANEKCASNVELIRCDMSRWVRDYVHLGPSGERKIANFIFDEREAIQFLSDQKEVRQAPFNHGYGIQGKPIEELHMLEIANMHWDHFQDECDSLHFLWSYLEGGNCKFGESKEGTPFVLIGKDSVELNRGLISRELKYIRYNLENNKVESSFQEGKPFGPASDDLISDEYLKKIFSRDYGIAPENIHFIEQPFAFHIDMGLCLAGGKRVLVNDSVAAFDVSLERFKGSSNKKTEKISKEDETRVEELRVKAQTNKILEDQSEIDLIDQGFEVIRVPGIFSDPYSELGGGLTNFFNHVTMTTKSEPPGKIIYGLGSSPGFKDLFKEHIVAYFPKNFSYRIYTTDYSITQEALRNGGGVNCMMQTFVGEWSKPDPLQQGVV